MVSWEFLFLQHGRRFLRIHLQGYECGAWHGAVCADSSESWRGWGSWQMTERLTGDAIQVRLKAKTLANTRWGGGLTGRHMKWQHRIRYIRNQVSFLLLSSVKETRIISPKLPSALLLHINPLLYVHIMWNASACSLMFFNFHVFLISLCSEMLCSNVYVMSSCVVIRCIWRSQSTDTNAGEGSNSLFPLPFFFKASQQLTSLKQPSGFSYWLCPLTYKNPTMLLFLKISLYILI